MVEIVFLNGPPGCGKDTIGNALTHYYNIKMAGPLKLGCYNLFFGVNDHTLQPRDVIFELESVKNKEVVPNSGITWRQFLIETSENHMKKLFGEDIFGRIVRDSIINIHNKKHINKFVITDSGFEEEALPIIYEFGNSNCSLVKLVRKNCNFDKDSRSYINLAQYGVKEITIENNGTVAECVNKIRGFLIES